MHLESTIDLTISFTDSVNYFINQSCRAINLVIKSAIND